MQRSRRRFVRVSTLGLVALGVFIGVAARRPAAEKSAVPVRTLDDHHKVGPVAVGDRGATYHALEAEAFRTTTDFDDGVAVAERSMDGRLKARVIDRSGNEIATLRVDDDLAFSEPNGAERRMARHPTVRPTLGWANRQVHGLWRDRARTDLEWQDAFIRPAGSKAAPPEPLAVHTESSGGFTADARRQKAHAPLQGEEYVSRILKNGVEVGSTTWYVRDQVLVWDFPGLTRGSLAPKNLAGIGGAWPFTPDLEWVNTQNLAFYRFHLAVREKAQAVRQNRSPIGRFVAFLIPTLHANEPGCDGLHWLDRTVIRPCCDIHDRCYYAAGCSSWSWWWGSAYPFGWQCLACNATAIWCATADMFIGPPFQRDPY